MKNIRLITKNEWPSFCETYSREHHGWLVTVTVTTQALQTSASTMSEDVVAQDQPLQEVREAKRDRHDEIMVTVGKGDNKQSILVEDVAAVYEEFDDQKDLGLRIENSKAETTIVVFRVPAAPQELDGLAESER